MLQVDPKDRPSAENLLVNRLPPLMVQFMEEMSDFMPSEDGDDKEFANTRLVGVSVSLLLSQHFLCTVFCVSCV